MTELTKSICVAVLLADARTWFKRSFPREFVRSKDTAKHMRAAMKKENDLLFTLQNVDFDVTLKSWYERTLLRYGGNTADLPWT